MAIGPSKNDMDHTRRIELEANKLLVDASKKNNVSKYILVSSMYVTRPDTMVAVMLNTMVGNALGFKLQAENYIR
jgi:hypothetical protein